MSVKQVKVELKQGSGFRTECRAGKHTLIIDQPTPSGTDEGPTPLHFQLLALGGCIAAIGRIVASQKRLAIRGMEISVEGDIDTDGLLGKPSSNRVGFSAIVARVKLDTDLNAAEQEAFLHEVDERCPISENLQNGTSIKVVSVR